MIASTSGGEIALAFARAGYAFDEDDDLPDLTLIALAVAAKGWPVFPLGANKKPCIPKTEGGNGHLDATRDPDTIRRLFAHRGARLIGVPTGPDTFDVLDLDPRHGSDTWRAANIHLLPETRIHATLQGGEHYLFQHAPGVSNKAGKIAPGLDVRGSGGYVCVPPSPGYTVKSDADIAPWPDYLLALVVKANAERPARPNSPPQKLTDQLAVRYQGLANSYLTNVSRAAEGLKHETLRDNALALGGILDAAGFSEDDAVAWLLDALPDTVKDWNNARKTAIWGLREGRKRPIPDLEDRPRPTRHQPFGIEDPSWSNDAHAPGEEEANAASDEPPQDRWQEPGPDAEQVNRAYAPISWTWRDPTKIPPREWLIGTVLIRKYVTVLGAPGGTGKSAFAIALAFAFITGRNDILNLHVFDKGAVWLLTLEDDRDELERRLAAAMIEHKIRPQDIEGRLFINTASEEGRPLLLAKQNEHGVFVTCEDAERLENNIRALGVGMTVIDPMVKSHALTENSNEHMDKLIALANGVANRTRCSILIPAHTRKGGGEGGGRDAIRGGGALVDGARVNLTLVPMTSDEAKAFKLPTEDAFRYVRVQDAKANLTPRGKATWFELASVPIGNTAVNPLYKAGDNVQAAIAWEPPAAFDGLDGPTLTAIFAKLREGLGDGWHYSPARQAKQRWAGQVLAQLALKSVDQSEKILNAWLQSGVLTEANYLTPKRQEAKRIVLNEGLIAEMLAGLGTGFRHYEEDDR